MKADNVLDCDLAPISHAAIVRMVGTVEGVSKREGGRLCIEGSPIPDHPLIGQADPLDDSSQNPITYGQITVTW